MEIKLSQCCTPSLGPCQCCGPSIVLTCVHSDDVLISLSIRCPARVACIRAQFCCSFVFSYPNAIVETKDMWLLLTQQLSCHYSVCNYAFFVSRFRLKHLPHVVMMVISIIYSCRFLYFHFWLLHLFLTVPTTGKTCTRVLVPDERCSLADTCPVPLFL